MAAFVAAGFPQGMIIIEDIHLAMPVTTTVDRTCRERLLSWPWKPWIKTKKVTEKYPDPNVYTVGELIICHPAVALRIKREFHLDTQGRLIRRREIPLP